jgi:hypothetical protein
VETLMMTTNSTLQYKFSGIRRLSGYKQTFNPDIQINNDTAVNDFVNLFCEYQLADNNYMNIHQEAVLHANDETWFNSLNPDQVLRLITYIIWTDKFLEGFLAAKVKDKTLYYLLSRLGEFQEASVLPVTGD